MFTRWTLSVNSMNSVQLPKKILSFLVNHFYNGANRHAIVTYFVGTTKQINHQIQDSGQDLSENPYIAWTTQCQLLPISFKIFTGKYDIWYKILI